MPEKKIALVGTYYTESVGDALLFECVKYLYNKSISGYVLKFKIVDMYGRISIKHRKHGLHEKIRNYLTRNYGIKFDYSPKTAGVPDLSYYENAFADCDMVTVAGGGLFKYSVGDNFTQTFSDINSAAKKLGIPVVYNALGVEGVHIAGTEPFKKLQSAFGDEVKLISCRERFDVIEMYFKDRFKDRISLVADTGVWVKEAFHAKRDRSSKIIGINPVSPYFFNMHGRDITEDELKSFWTELILKSDRQGYKIQIFTNGNNSDYRFAYKIYISVKNKLRNKPLIREADDPAQMVKNISRCSIIAASRLHTCISGYSIGIPVVGIAWNNKLLNWGKTICMQDCFFDINELTSRRVFDKMMELKEYSYDEELNKSLKRSIESFAKESVELLLKEGVN